MQDSVFPECSSQCCSVFPSLVSLIALFLLLNESNPHTLTLECTSFIRLFFDNVSSPVGRKIFLYLKGKRYLLVECIRKLRGYCLLSAAETEKSERGLKV